MSNILKMPAKTKADDGRRSVSAERKLKKIRGEVVSTLEDRIEELRHEAAELHGTMDQVLKRVRSQGFGVQLGDLKSGKWHRLKSEIGTLQEILAYMDSLDSLGDD